MENFKHGDNKKLQVSNESVREYFESQKEKEERIAELKKMSDEGTLDNVNWGEYLKEVEYVQESRADVEMREKMREAVRPFVQEKIDNNQLDLACFGNHDHLGFANDEFWGHYISPTKGGLVITMYQKKQIKGDPMDIEGERGEGKQILLELDQEYRKKLVEKLKNDLIKWEVRKKEPDYEYHDWDERTIAGLEEAVELLS